MANNGIFYTSGNTLDFTTTGTTWARLSSGGTFSSLGISAATYYNLPFSGTVTGSGTTDYIIKWDGSGSGLTDSTISDDGTIVTIPVLSITSDAYWNVGSTEVTINEDRAFYPLYVSNDNTTIYEIENEGILTTPRATLNSVFLTLNNQNDHRAIQIFYTITSEDDLYYRSGNIIANWNSLYTRFNQSEYGPSGIQPSPDTIDIPTVQYNGVGTAINIYLSGTYSGRVTLKLKYTFL